MYEPTIFKHNHHERTSGAAVGDQIEFVKNEFYGTILYMYTAVYKKTGHFYSAWIEEFSGVNTQGRTKKEAKQNLKEALLLVLEARRKNGVEAGVTREKISL